MFVRQLSVFLIITLFIIQSAFANPPVSNINPSNPILISSLLEKNLPDPTSLDYIRTSITYDKDQKQLNHQYHKNGVKHIEIVGKKLIFQKGHPNGLYEKFHDFNDIKSIDIVAEELIIRDRINLPQTDVNILVDTIVFKDQGSSTASIVTTPRDKTGSVAQSEDGANGLNAGSIVINLNSYSFPDGNTLRLIANGGNGQKGGEGKPGERGKIVTSTRTLHKVKGFDGKVHTINNVVYLEAPNGAWLWGTKAMPTRGTDAKAGGAPGNGGDGGSITFIGPRTPFDWYVSFGAGNPGEPTPAFKGGEPGSPRFATHVKRPPDWMFNPVFTTYVINETAVGTGLDSKQISGNKGKEGKWNISRNQIDDHITLKLLSVKLSHIKDAYLNRKYKYVKENIESLLKVIDNKSVEKDEREELRLIQQEFLTLQTRLDHHLDYFGHTAGWVPMLSFEVNKSAFEQEIERAFRVLYLHYWITNEHKSLEEKRNGLVEARQATIIEIEELKKEHKSVSKLIPALQVEAAEIANKIYTTQLNLQQLERKIEKDANDNVENRHKVPEWKKMLKVAGAICNSIPVYQPALGVIGNGASRLAQIDENSSWKNITNVASVAKQFSTQEYKDSYRNMRKTLRNIKVDPKGDVSTKAQIKKIRRAYGPIIKGIVEQRELFSKTEIPRSEIDKEIQKMKESNQAFQEVSGMLESLIEEKQLFLERLSTALSDFSRITTQITNNLAGINALNNSIGKVTDGLSFETISFLDEMHNSAKDRLLHYNYILAKSYEYRILEPFEYEINLTKVIEKIKKIVEGSSEAKLDKNNFMELSNIFEASLSGIVSDILKKYNENPPEKNIGTKFRLLPAQLKILNSGNQIRLNLKDDLDLFQEGEENIRIVNISINTLKLDYDQEDIDNLSVAYFDLIIQHSGEHKIQTGEDYYIFRSAQSANNNTNKLDWGVRKDLIENSKPIEFTISEASDSLLQSLLGKLVGMENVDDPFLYSRPSALGDLIIKTRIKARGTTVKVKEVVFEVEYDFTL